MQLNPQQHAIYEKTFQWLFILPFDEKLKENYLHDSVLTWKIAFNEQASIKQSHMYSTSLSPFVCQDFLCFSARKREKKPSRKKIAALNVSWMWKKIRSFSSICVMRGEMRTEQGNESFLRANVSIVEVFVRRNQQEDD